MSGRTTTVIDIRELLRHLQQNQSNRAVHRALGLSRETVAKYRQWAEKEGLLSGPLPSLADLQTRLQASLPSAPPQTVSTVEPYRAVVVKLREEGLEIEALYQRLREGHGYTGKYSSVWRFVRALEPKRPDAVVRVEVAPGEEAQVDFGAAGRLFDPQQQKVRKAWIFVMTLSFSRHQYVEIVFDQTVPTWLELHRHAFEFFGGVPQRVVLDNLKAAITQACVDDPQVQRAYWDCAEHYHFLIRPCRVATPEHKGKVENGVRYVTRNFLAGRDYTTPQHHVQQANQDARRWVTEVAGVRRHGTTKRQPLEQFTAIEQARLQPLPAEPFEAVMWKQVKLHRDCYVVFDNAYYSAPHRAIGELLWVCGTAKKVQIYREFELLATHSRATQPGQRQTLLDHLPPEKVAGLTLTPQACLDRAAQIGPYTAEAMTLLLAERPVDRLRAVHRLLTQAEKEGAARFERACARALAYHAVTVRTLHNILTSGVADLPEVGLRPEAAPEWPTHARPVNDLVPAEWRR